MSATFRIPPIALLGVFGLALAATPVAFGLPGLQVLYVVPVGLGVWLLRTRTVAGPDGLVARRVLRSRTMPWSELDGLRVPERAWARAVLRSGEEVPLPAVRARDLPVLAAVSGGWLSDPTAEPSAEAPAEPE